MVLNPSKGGELTPFHSGVAFLLGFCPFFSIAAANVVLFLFILLLSVDLVRKKTSLIFHRTPFDIVLMGAICVWFFAGLAGFSPVESFKKTGFIHHVMVFYLLLFSYRGRLLQFVLWGLFIGCGLNVVYGLAQYLLWKGIYDFQAGELPGWFMALGEKWQKYIALSPKDERIHGALHLMTYSELLLPGFFFWGARFLEKRKGWNFLFGFLLTGGALVLAAQRGPLLGAVMGLILIFVVHPRRMRLVLPVLFLGLLAFFSPASREKIGRVLTLKGIQENHRVSLWKGGLYLFKRHPLLGVGPGQIKRATQFYKTDPAFPPNPKGQEGDLHNYYLQRTVEMGVPGSIVAVGLLGVFLLTGYRFYREKDSLSPELIGGSKENMNALAVGIFASFFSLLFINVTERALDDAEVALVFWMLAAFSVWVVKPANQMGSQR